jgi:hypothetical protein
MPKLTLVKKLSKEEEGEGNADAEVTREDQDKINGFSRLHQREKVLVEELQTKQVGPNAGYYSSRFVLLFRCLVLSLCAFLTRTWFF